MLSMFEGRLLDAHLRRCASCRAFSAGVEEQTDLLRSAAFEELLRPVTIPETRSRIRRGIVGAAGSALAAAAAAAVLVLPGAGNENGRTAHRVGSPILVAFAASPTPSAKVDVPRLRLQPASIADGPVHGRFSVPAVV
jgi:predicted anti-sigma-YlaC factor YlaD